jgi:hypothetical protein
MKKIARSPRRKVGMTNNLFKMGPFTDRWEMGTFQTSLSTLVLEDLIGRTLAVIEASSSYAVLVLVLEKVSPPLALFSRGSCSAIVKCVGRRGVYLLSYFIEDCRDESVVVYKFTSSRLCIL